jgi:hypothetical protein
LDLRISGTPVHTRGLTLLVSELGDGRVRALGRVVDLRKSGFNPMFGDVQPAGLIHDMDIDAEVDLASGRLEKLATAQRRVAVEPAPSTQGESCRDPAPRLQALVGRSLYDADFPRALGAVHGGPRGCSHLLTLFQMIADALPPALARERALRASGARRRVEESVFRRSMLFDGMLREREAFELAISLSDWHNAPAAGDGTSPPGLVHVHEVRVHAEVGLASARVQRISAAERARETTWPRDPWVDRSADAQVLVGHPILPGLGGQVRKTFTAPGDRMLAHALLHLAPGFVQCTAVFSELAAGSPGTEAPAGSRAARPLIPIGGYTDSCYMWRADGPLIQLRERRSRG